MTKRKNPIHLVDEETVLEALDAAFIQGYELRSNEERMKAQVNWVESPRPRSLDPEIAAAKLKLLQATGQMVDANARLISHVADTLTDGKRF